VLAGGRVQAIYRKMFLPNYGVFDEHRYFQVGDAPAVIGVGDTTLGLTICEDIWEPGPPASDEALAGAEVIVNVSASPYHRGKGAQRERMLVQRARDSLAYVAFCNLVGGQDELVFDGYSLVVDEHGELVARGAQFKEELVVCDIDPSTADAARLRDARHRPTRDIAGWPRDAWHSAPRHAGRRRLRIGNHWHGRGPALRPAQLRRGGPRRGQLFDRPFGLRRLQEQRRLLRLSWCRFAVAKRILERIAHGLRRPHTRIDPRDVPAGSRGRCLHRARWRVNRHRRQGIVGNRHAGILVLPPQRRIGGRSANRFGLDVGGKRPRLNGLLGKEYAECRIQNAAGSESNAERA